MRIKLLVCQILLTLILAGCTGVADKTTTQPTSAGQYEQKLEKQLTVKLDYLLFLPEGYGKEEKKWPLILFLHGAGERGEDLEKVKLHGPPKMVEKQKDFPFIVLSPQCPKDQWWPHNVDPLITLLDDVISHYNVDPKRVYLTGLSMGGFGAWNLGCAYPERFAAIAPICGGGQPYLAKRLKNVPVWAFHGAKDKVIPPKRSQEMVEQIKKIGGEARLTVYPKAGHNAWTATYSNPELYKWFLSHEKSKRVNK
jgi:predicted peptidase